MSLYADIIVDISHEKLDKPFQYRIPKHLEEVVKIGSKLTVPFGNGNRPILGYCIGISNKPKYDIEKIKEILEEKESKLDSKAQTIQLADFIKKRYGVTLIQALKLVSPARALVKPLEHKKIARAIPLEELQEYYLKIKDKKNQKARIKVVEELLTKEELGYDYVNKKLGVSLSSLYSLEKEGIISLVTITQLRNPVKLTREEEALIVLNEKQQQIVDEISSKFSEKEANKYLIHGITGSGKTAVYIALIEEVIKAGKEAIVLIPEIALTYQTLKRFYQHFGDRVSVLNSSLSSGERQDQLYRAQTGDISIMIGPRSALFTPFTQIGLIIIDEEHESTYKSEQSPKYHAREVAEEIGRIHGASLVLGSATPSLETYYKVKQGEYTLFELDQRATGGSLPQVHVVDLREELRKGNRSIFSDKLQEGIQQRLEKKEQIILFLNRRGYAGFVNCRSCGHVMKCKQCSVSLSQHKNQSLQCHYCGYTTPAVTLCPSCGSKYILGFRAGTQQIEEKIKELFPGIRTLRMDADTTSKKGSYERILSSFERGEADVLIGTQMIVKGHDFPNVTLMGILAADLSLSVGDYKAAERTFQLLTQAAGRAGRGDKAGEVVIQSYQPDHYSIQYAAKQDYQNFYEEEISFRKLMSYPPSGNLLAVQMIGEDDEGVKNLASTLAEEIKKGNGSNYKVQVLGPTEACVHKIKGYYRHVIYVKARGLEELLEIKEMLELRKIQHGFLKEMMQFDFDPMHMF